MDTDTGQNRTNIGPDNFGLRVLHFESVEGGDHRAWHLAGIAAAAAEVLRPGYMALYYMTEEPERYGDQRPT